MKKADHNKTYSAADIQRYHAGELSMQERHALEKAALDDPFLADALEGYQHAATPQADLAALEQQLEDRITPQRKRTTPLFFRSPYMRAAALVLLLAGAGWTVYQFTFTGKEDLAIAPTIATEKQDTPARTTVPPPSTVDSTTLVNTPATEEARVQERAPQEKRALVAKPTPTPAPVKEQALADEVASLPPPAAVASAPAESKIAPRETEFRTQKEEATANLTKSKTQPAHTFKGQVLDAEGNPIPHASITINGKPTGTTSNLQGRFSLSAPDSVLNATVSAVGFDVNRLSLNSEEEKTVVLNEASDALSEVVVTGYGKKRSKNTRPSSAHTKAEVEELEPENGWTSFNRYIAENIQVPEEIASKQISGDVELSFEVNKDGEPVNIKVQKSLCASCDKEAIRLLQEGPGWKKKKRKSGKVKIRF